MIVSLVYLLIMTMAVFFGGILVSFGIFFYKELEMRRGLGALLIVCGSVIVGLAAWLARWG